MTTHDPLMNQEEEQQGKEGLVTGRWKHYFEEFNGKRFSTKQSKEKMSEIYFGKKVRHIRKRKAKSD